MTDWSAGLLQVTRAGRGRAVSVVDRQVVQCWPLATTQRRRCPPVSVAGRRDAPRVTVTLDGAAAAAAAEAKRSRRRVQTTMKLAAIRRTLSYEVR